MIHVEIEKKVWLNSELHPPPPLDFYKMVSLDWGQTNPNTNSFLTKIRFVKKQGVGF